MKPGYFDRNMNPISLDEWALKVEDMDYKFIRQETIGRYLISTIWMGIDHNFYGSAPLIFETMIFVDSKDPNDELHLYQARYTTEAQAITGHEEAVAMVFDTLRQERDKEEAASAMAAIKDVLGYQMLSREETEALLRGEKAKD